MTSNHISEKISMMNNTLWCQSYGPDLTNCTCTDPSYTYSEHCGYGRCLFNSTTGCSKNTFLNISGCRLAPYSQCVTTCPKDQFYEAHAQTCLPVTVCSTEFADPSSPLKYRDAYEVSPVGVDFDRQCSICSSCPEGFMTVPCTATSNSRCTRSGRLSSGDVAAVMLSVLTRNNLETCNSAKTKKHAENG